MMTRRAALLLPLLLAGCGSREKRTFPPLRYDHLLPLQLNVAAIAIEQRFAPSNASPDVSQYAPVSPLRALRTMAEDRLQALGSGGQATFIIQDASLTRRRDTLSGSFAVQLDVRGAPGALGAPTGYARAQVSGSYTGDLGDLSGPLYDLTKDLMDRMNVEFEYQVRRSLAAWLVPAGANRAPVEQQPLTR